MIIPEDLYYTVDHEWVKQDGEHLIVGITDFAQGELGEIVYVEVDTVESELEKGAQFGTVEAVKTVSDLLMPVSGEVVELNDSLEDAPEKVNEDPYAEGWIIKMKAKDENWSADLLSAEAYRATTAA